MMEFVMMKSPYQVASVFVKTALSIEKEGAVILYVKYHLLLQCMMLLPKPPS